MTNLDSILKSRDITLPTKVHLVKAMVFAVVMYGCESWTIKKAECWRIDAFELWCWRRLLSVPWTARRSKQSILNIHWKNWCLSWNPNTLATWSEVLTHCKRPWCWERLKQEEKGITEDEIVGWHHRLNGHVFGWTLAVGDGQGGLACYSQWGLKELDTTEWLNWTELNWYQNTRKSNQNFAYGFSVFVLFAVSLGSISISLKKNRRIIAL